MKIEGKIRKKCKRHNIPGHPHELTFCCFHNQNFLSKRRTCDWLVESIQQAREKHDFSLWAYVFMPNHVHLLINPRQKEYSISKILSSIKRPVAMKAIAWLKKHNPTALKILETGLEYRKYRFWQKGGGYDRNIIKIDTLIEIVKYIHLNTVRKGLVSNPKEWHYSSVSQWSNTSNGPLAIDKNDWPVFT